jgi:hypothetical protein
MKSHRPHSGAHPSRAAMTLPLTSKKLHPNTSSKKNNKNSDNKWKSLFLALILSALAFFSMRGDMMLSTNTYGNAMISISDEGLKSNAAESNVDANFQINEDSEDSIDGDKYFVNPMNDEDEDEDEYGDKDFMNSMNNDEDEDEDFEDSNPSHDADADSDENGVKDSEGNDSNEDFENSSNDDEDEDENAQIDEDHTDYRNLEDENNQVNGDDVDSSKVAEDENAPADEDSDEHNDKPANEIDVEESR